MREYIIERTRRNGEYIAQTGCTVRTCAAHFSISKSTVHKDVTERLAAIDYALFRKVQKVLGINLSERHLRGGNATRIKYQDKKERLEGESKRSAAEQNVKNL